MLEYNFNLFKSKHMSYKERPYIFDIPEVRRPITKSISLVKPPEILVIHLQRLTYSNTGYLIKNNQFVQFETTLNMAPYVGCDLSLVSRVLSFIKNLVFFDRNHWTYWPRSFRALCFISESIPVEIRKWDKEKLKIISYIRTEFTSQYQRRVEWF